jgi:hypothetical protein
MGRWAFNIYKIMSREISVTTWSIRDREGVLLRSYTATWCKPCSNIKPAILEAEKAGEITFLHDEVTEKPTGMVIPRFELITETGGAKFDFIQTSNREKFRDFFTGKPLPVDMDF